MKHSLNSLIQGVLAKQYPNSTWQLTLLTHWPAIVGNLYTVMRLEKIIGSTLIIGVYDASWLQELYLLSPTLKATINQYLDSAYVKQIRFKQVAPTPMHVPITVEKQDDRILSSPLTAAQETALSHIQDPQLRGSLHAFLARCLSNKARK